MPTRTVPAPNNMEWCVVGPTDMVNFKAIGAHLETKMGIREAFNNRELETAVLGKLQRQRLLHSLQFHHSQRNVAAKLEDGTDLFIDLQSCSTFFHKNVTHDQSLAQPEVRDEILNKSCKISALMTCRC